MKRLFLALAAFLPGAVLAQNAPKFTIKGKLNNLNGPAMAYFGYQFGANGILDSAAVVNGTFTFNGDLLFPTTATVIIDHNKQGLARLREAKNADAINFYLDKGIISITSANDSVVKAKITGSVANDDYNLLNSQVSVVFDRARKLKATDETLPAAQRQSPQHQQELMARSKELQQEYEGVMTRFITTHPKSFVSLMALSSLGGPAADPAIIEPLYNSLDPSVKELEPAKLLHNMIEASKVTAIGAVAPDFTLPDVNGAPVALSSFRGKYVLVDFWASWCGPCRMENPSVVSAYNKYKIKQFTIVGVSLDRPEGKDAWLNAIKSDGLSWTQVSDLQFWDSKAAKLYGVTSIPQNFLIDPNGKIIAKSLRGEDLEAKLAEIFGKI